MTTETVEDFRTERVCPRCRYTIHPGYWHEEMKQPDQRAGHLDGGHIATDPELILVRRDEWDAVRGDKCLLEDEVARLHLALGEIASTSAWPANEMAREALGE